MRLILGVLLIGLVACDGDETESTTASATSSAKPPASATPRPKPPRYDDDKLHVPADFEAEADQAITKDNYQAALAELRRAITGEEGDEHEGDDQEDEQVAPPEVTPTPTAAPKAPPTTAPKAPPPPTPKAPPTPAPEAPPTPAPEAPTE